MDIYKKKHRRAISKSKAMATRGPDKNDVEGHVINNWTRQFFDCRTIKNNG